MNDLLSIPCVLMRGGTSRGPFFLASDLPAEPAARDALLLAIMGTGHPLQIDGIGGGNPVTSKVAIVGPSLDPAADVDYLFAQVRVAERVAERVVDTSPNCGNMLSAVGPFAIEAGLVPAGSVQTRVRIRNLNTGKLIEAKVPTPGGHVAYLGAAAIDGVPGLAAPVMLSFLDAAGSKTGALLPTGRPLEKIQGLEASCIDCAMPMVLLRAADLGLTGGEAPEALSADAGLIRRLESLRVEAGRRMGIADAADRVIPKPVLLSPAVAGGTLRVRYFMPRECHPTLAVTGAVGLATACATAGTLAYALGPAPVLPTTVILEHPAGRIAVELERRFDQTVPVAGLIRTARRLFEGRVFARPPEALAVAAA